MRRRSPLFYLVIGAVLALLAALFTNAATASTPSSSTLTPTGAAGTATVAWDGGPYTVPVLVEDLCTSATCDTHDLHVNVPSGFWSSHDGGVHLELTEHADVVAGFDVVVHNAAGDSVGTYDDTSSANVALDLGKLPAGDYKVTVVPVAGTNTPYHINVAMSYWTVGSSMKYPETRDAIANELVQNYPLNVVFVGRTPTAAEVAELKANIPDHYSPTVVNKTTAQTPVQGTASGLLNWNQAHYDGTPYLEPIRYNYQLHIYTASDDYAKALFATEAASTAKDQPVSGGRTAVAAMAQYDATKGNFRVLAKNGDVSYKVTDPTKVDEIDAYATEDWIFNTRNDAKWSCAFRDVETGACQTPSIIQPDRGAYHDPYYDKFGLNLDRMPEGLNKGSSFFFLDTFTPAYAKNYFRPNAYHAYTTDKVIDGQIKDGSVANGGSWRITDPDSGAHDGVSFARTWGGRYRFHFIDLGASPNSYESATWAGEGLGMSSDYPHGDPPVWEYTANPLWNQAGATCVTDLPTGQAVSDLPYTNNTPCRMAPRLARDVLYGLIFRSTAGYLYRPVPRGDVYWLAVSNWTDFYSRPQWVGGQLTSAPWYGNWWTDMSKLYQIGDVSGGRTQDDTLRWLSSALPYARWVGRKNEVIPLYDPTTNQATGKVLDTSPKYEDLPAPDYHVAASAAGVSVAPEPLATGQHVVATYGNDKVDLTGVSNAIEAAKASGLTGMSYDDSVSDTYMRDYIDQHRAGIADQVTGVNTIPSINVVFEKAFTWAMPAIVGGIAEGTEDGEAWGVLNNVNDRFKWDQANYPAVQPGDPVGSKHSTQVPALPTQATGGGFSYTIEHEAAHNLGLSHPHDGSLGISKCPAGDPKAGQWECYWDGLGFMYDVSAAPTTYAMAYRPYEVEDQDNLQRGHVAEYLVSAQDALTDRLSQEAKAGRTTPSAGWNSDFARMKTWRTLAGKLFRRGDYLHAEYAARNAALAARGVPQTSANTVDPRLLQAGQVYYFNVHPQPSGEGINLVPIALTASQPARRSTVLTATVANQGSGAAYDVVAKFSVGSTVIGTSDPVDLEAGKSAAVPVTWNTSAVSGSQNVTVTVDPANALAETNEGDNARTTAVVVRPNALANGSFETGNATSAPSWTLAKDAKVSTAKASDGTRSVALTAGSAAATVTSATTAVTAGQSYALALSSSVATTTVSLQFYAKGAKLGAAQPVMLKATASGAWNTEQGSFTAPAGATQVAVTASAATVPATTGAVYVDDVWFW